MNRTVTLSCALVVAFISTLGCGPSSPPTATVTGTVNYKGQPLTMGRITFIDPAGHPELGDIGPNGKYTVKARLGASKVTIYAHEPTKPNPDTKHKILELPGKSLIPERYEGDKSDLKADVKAGDNKFDFDLKD
jgi:hypothetical protein